MAMVGLVALMACANVGSLLLVRAAGRIREMSVRYALGAKRARVVQQLLVEGLLLGLAGGVLGIAIAPRISAWLINMIWSRTAGDLPFSSHPDLRILLFNFSLALLVSLIFSLAPAAQFWRPNLAPALKQQAMTAGSGPLRFRRISVAVQIGLSILVLVGAGLFVRTLHNLKSLNVGFADRSSGDVRHSADAGGISTRSNPRSGYTSAANLGGLAGSALRRRHHRSGTGGQQHLEQHHPRRLHRKRKRGHERRIAAGEPRLLLDHGDATCWLAANSPTRIASERTKSRW